MRPGPIERVQLQRARRHLTVDARGAPVADALKQLEALAARFGAVHALDVQTAAQTTPQAASALRRIFREVKRLEQSGALTALSKTETVDEAVLARVRAGDLSKNLTRHVQRLAALQLYRWFDHPTVDAGFRDGIEQELRTHFRVQTRTLRKNEGRPDLRLVDEHQLKRTALLVTLERKDLPEPLMLQVLTKLAEVGQPEDRAVVARVTKGASAAVRAQAVETKRAIQQAAKMTIVLAGFEAKPYVTGGGLGNVLKELPPALARMGHRVIVLMPRHTTIEAPLENTGKIGTVYGPKLEQFGLMRDVREGVEYYFIENDNYFSKHRNGVYRDPYGDYGDSVERYDFFGASIPVALRMILGETAPDVVQLNDAHTATGAVYLKRDPAFEDTAVVMGIHNLGAAYQGRYDAKHVDDMRFAGLGLYYPTGPAEAWGEMNLLKLGLVESDAAITVSRRYMEEILTEAQGEGLHGVLRTLRSRDQLWGNLNGIEAADWNAETDPLIAQNFSFHDPSGKAACKADLQRRFGLPVRPDVPLIGVVARLSSQKGIDDIAATIRRMKEQGRDLQIAICGEGDPEIAGAIEALAIDHPGTVGFDSVFSSEKEHVVLAGSDFFLMPSRFEPCGLPQMYALRYLTVPIVRAVGGLQESIDDYDATSHAGTGFKFTHDIDEAMVRALEWYATEPSERLKLLRNCALADFSWDSTSAPEQVAFYRKTRNRRAHDR